MPYVTVKLDSSIRESVQRSIGSFSEKIQRRVFRLAGKKAMAVLVENIKKHVPYDDTKAGARKRAKSGRGHIRDNVIYKTLSYPSSNKVLFIAGYRSGTNQLQTLMEKSNYLTSPRRKNHESKTGRIMKPAGFMRDQERYQTRSGAWKTRKLPDKKRRDNRLSTGSRLIRGVSGSSEDQPSTGDFPRGRIPFRPLEKAFDESISQMQSIVNNEIRAGIERILKKRET